MTSEAVLKARIALLWRDPFRSEVKPSHEQNPGWPPLL